MVNTVLQVNPTDRRLVQITPMGCAVHWRLYAIHGTTLTGIGLRVSHGCVRCAAAT